MRDLTPITDLPFFDDRLHFALEYPLEGQETADGKLVDLPIPKGYSGSLIWRSNRASQTSQKRKATDAKIVGLAHTWDAENQSLIATRIEPILEFIRMIESINIQDV